MPYLVLLCCICAAACSMVTSADSAADIAHEEFEIGREGRLLLVPVALNATTYLFAIDTGSALTIFDSTLRAELGDVQGRVTLRTAMGDAAVDVFNCPDATLGRFDLRSCGRVACFDLRHLRAASGKEIGGILGMSLLRQFVLHVDFDRGMLRLSKAAPREGSCWSETLPMAFASDGRPLVNANVCGTVREEFVIDTGATMNSMRASLFDRLAAKGRIELGARSTSMTLTGEVANEMGRLESITLGPFKHTGVLGCRDRASALGLQYLSRYIITFDFPRASLQLRVGRSFSAPESCAMCGIAILRLEGRTLVHGVKPDSPAEEAGIAPNDEIVAIDGQPIEHLDLFEIGRKLTSEAGKRVIFKIRRSQKELEMSLELVDRFAPAGQA